MSKRNLVVGLLATVGIIFVGLTAVFLHIVWSPGNIFEAQLAQIQQCMGRNDAIACARPVVRGMLQTKSGAEIIDALATHLPALRCHYVGHVVGQELYRNTKNVETALSECSRACDSTCVHGVVGEAFAEELGLGTPDEEQDFDLEHLSADEISTIGRSLCTSADACHGVGHALFQATKMLDGAMSACRGLVTDATSSTCYTGAAMEYADVLALRSMRDIPEITYPEDRALPTLCDLPLQVERRACFRYYPRMVIETLAARGISQTQATDRVRELCRSMPRDQDRSACFFGLGRLNSYLIATDQDAARALCSVEQSERDQASCYFGEVYLAVDERQEQLVQYCGALASASLRAACYQELGYYLYREGVSSEQTAKFCKPTDALCKQSFTQFALDPWLEIPKRFER